MIPMKHLTKQTQKINWNCFYWCNTEKKQQVKCDRVINNNQRTLWRDLVAGGLKTRNWWVCCVNSFESVSIGFFIGRPFLTIINYCPCKIYYRLKNMYLNGVLSEIDEFSRSTEEILPWYAPCTPQSIVIRPPL